MNKKCYVDYIGCEKRKLDTQRILNYLRRNGYDVTSKIEDADLLVLVTCAFYQKYEDWSITKLANLYRRRKSGSRVVVGGCLPDIHAARLKEYPEVTVIGPRDLQKFDDLLDAAVRMETVADPNTSEFDSAQYRRYSSERPKAPAQLQYEKAKRAFKIRIAWGCLGNCSYCVTQYATGRLKSKPLSDILHEFRAGQQADEPDFFITAGDTGAYGQDIGSSIVELFQAIFASPGDYRIHCHDFGIHWFRKYLDPLLEVLGRNNARLGCFSLPIQSGSDRILKSMRRPYTIADVERVLDGIRRAAPHMKIGSHFIVAFPGETEEDFDHTLKLVDSFDFDFLNVFPYTDHVRAASHKYPGKLSQDVALSRYRRLFEAFENKIK